jgi:uncharacterized membrane protein
MPGIQIARVLHLVGIIFWIGSMWVRLILLSFARSGTGEGVRSQLYQFQRGIHLRMEIPAFLLALLAGGFLIHPAGVTFQQVWFIVKIAGIFGMIVVTLLTSRQFKVFNASGQVGQTAGLLVMLIVCVLLIVFATRTRFLYF